MRGTLSGPRHFASRCTPSDRHLAAWPTGRHADTFERTCACASSITATASMAAAPRACSRGSIANGSPRRRSRSSYRPLEHKGSRAAVLARLLRRRRERLRRLPLLAGSAPDLVVRPPRVGLPAAGRRGPFPRRRDRPQVLRSDGEELHEVPGRHRRREVRVRRGAARGADRMGGDHRRRAVPERQDGGRAEGAGAAPDDVHREQPATGDRGTLHRRSGEPAARRDRRRSLRRRAAEAAAGAAHAQHRDHPDEGASWKGTCAFFDLADQETAAFNKFISYYLFPAGPLFGRA